MRRYQSGKDLFFQTDEFLPLSQDPTLLGAEIFFKNFTFTKWDKIRQTLRAHQDHTGLEGYIHLEAHGEYDDTGNWCFSDQGKRYNLQEWVNSLDGQTSAIFLSICNEMRHSLSSTRSVLVYPLAEISGYELNCLGPDLLIISIPENS